MTPLIFCALIVFPFPSLSAFQETEVDGFYLDISSSGPQKISKLVIVKFGLSEKHTKFEKICLMVLTNQLIYLVNVKTIRQIFSNYVCFSQSPNFTMIHQVELLSFLKTCKSVDWPNFQIVKWLKPVAIFWWYYWLKINLLVALLRQIYRLLENVSLDCAQTQNCQSCLSLNAHIRRSFRK